MESILPYVHPKPKAVEFAPEMIVQLAQDIAAARAEGARPPTTTRFAEMVDKFVEENERRREASTA